MLFQAELEGLFAGALRGEARPGEARQERGDENGKWN